MPDKYIATNNFPVCQFEPRNITNVCETSQLQMDRTTY